MRDHNEGLGLGLSIVRRLSMLLDHPVSLASRLGQGTRFTVLLPAVVASGSVQGPASGPPFQAIVPAGWTQGPVPTGCVPDAVVADYRLRGARNGCNEVQALARALGRQRATLMVTGETAPETLRLLAASGLPWLSKPLQPARLRSWLAGACEL